MKGRSSIAFKYAIIIFLTICLAFSIADAKTKKVEMKTGNEQTALMFNHVEKLFIVNKSTSKNDIKQLAMIENAVFVIDSGIVPPKSLTNYIASTGKAIKVVLPNNFTKAQLKRLKDVKNWEAIFRVSASDFTDNFVNSVLSLGIIPRVFEMDHKELTEQVIKKLTKIRNFKLRLLVPENETISDNIIWTLNRKKLAGLKEIVLPSVYPSISLKKLTKLKKTQLILQAKAGKLSKEQVTLLNTYKNLTLGATLRGLIKKDEAKEYMMLNNLRSITMQIEGWKITDDFVNLMNSKGEIIN